MYITFKKEERIVIKTYELSEKEMEILQFIQKNERIDFRQRKYGEENPKDETGTFQYDETTDLRVNEFIEEDDVWWNSYILTPFGKLMLEDEVK